MHHFLIVWGSWCLAPFGLLGMYAVGRRKRWGWVVSITTQVLWYGYAVGTGQYGFTIGTTLYLCVYIKNWLGWGRKSADPLAEVIAILHDLNRMELEKDRDGNAEVPWWYVRDAVRTATGVEFIDELPDEEEVDE